MLSTSLSGLDMPCGSRQAVRQIPPQTQTHGLHFTALTHIPSGQMMLRLLCGRPFVNLLSFTCRQQGIYN